MAMLNPSLPFQPSVDNLVFDASVLQHETNIGPQFIWPDNEKPGIEPAPELFVPPIDLGGFISNDDPMSVAEAARLVNKACRKHGFFLVVNHGVDPGLLAKAHEYTEFFFGLPLSEKEKGQRKKGDICGYASSFTGRFTSKLPWKETLSFQYSSHVMYSNMVEKCFENDPDQKFKEFGKVFEDYCKAMSKLSLEIMELLGASLGVGRSYFKEFFEGNDSIMRLNYYPRCQKPDLALGTGPHCDPTSLTVLHQDHVQGLQVFVDQKWHSIRPHSDAFVVNIGDTFMALTNGVYKSCLHRALVNSLAPRKSLAFFLCPREDKVIRPPQELMSSTTSRIYPDFKWPVLLEFTQTVYRADERTLDAFTKWLQETPSPK